MASALSRQTLRALRVRLYSTAANPDAGEYEKCRPYLRPQPPRLTRLPNGITVASIENYSPVSRIALVANAGARFEDGDNVGITHCLRVAAGLSTQNSTAFAMTRGVEQAGGEFTCTSSREFMFYKMNCLRDNLDLVFKTLTQPTTVPAFKPWELSDMNKQLTLDLAIMKSQPHIWLYDLIHQAAYRDTLGRSLYAPEHKIGKYSSEQLLHYMKTYFAANRLALVGIGVDHDELIKLTKTLTPFVSSDIETTSAKYVGGELHVDIGGDLAYTVVAVQGPSLACGDLLHAAVLQHVMGMCPSVKYSCGTSTSHLANAIGKITSSPFAVSSVNANYSDSGLFGFSAISHYQEIEKVLRAAFDQFEAVFRNGVNEKDVARAKQQLKAQIGMYRESCDNLLMDLGEQALGCDEILSTQDLLKHVDNINTIDVGNIAKKFMDTKTSMAAVGNLSKCPHLGDLKK